MKNNKTYYIKTFGCQMNYSDSERIATICENIELTKADKLDNADLIVFNTCSVKQSAEDRIFGLNKNLAKLKAKRPNIKIIVTGCIVLRGNKQKNDEWQKILKRRIPWADFILPIKNIGDIPELLHNWTPSQNTDTKDNYFQIPPKYLSKYAASIPISTGCNHYCTYCIVPYSRGEEVNRTAKDILNDFDQLIKKGYKDITFLGQIVNKWQNPDKSSKIQTFTDLLKEIDKYNHDFWFTFLSSHPNYMSQELIDFMINSKHMRPYIHFAVQTGSNKMLKKMNRKHKIEEFINISKTLTENIPNLNLSTDIIVGFPGEDGQEFDHTIQMMQELQFDMAYISEYSPRSYTASSFMKDDVSHAEKERRKKLLNDEVLANSVLKKNKKMINRTFKTLITQIDGKTIKGKTSNYKDIKINNPANLKLQEGDFVTTKITKANNWGVEGQLI